MSDTLVVNEIYLSLQGESTFVGLPCIFVRLAACDLRCSYCDTAYAFGAGSKKSLADVRGEVQRLAWPFGEVRSPKSVHPPQFCYGGREVRSGPEPPYVGCYAFQSRSERRGVGNG